MQCEINKSEVCEERPVKPWHSQNRAKVNEYSLPGRLHLCPYWLKQSRNLEKIDLFQFLEEQSCRFECEIRSASISVT